MKIRVMQYFNVLIGLLIACFGISVFFRSTEVTAAVINGLSMCCNILIPALFPFLIVTSFLGNCPITNAIDFLCIPLSRILHLPRCCGSSVLLGMIGGYPAGASLISDGVKSGNITVSQGEAMQCSCICAGPSFLVLGIGSGMTHSVQIGVYLLISHLIASVVCGIIFRPKVRQISVSSQRHYDSGGDAFVKSVISSSSKLISICGFAIISGVFIAILKTLGIDNILLCGLIEVTAGCLSASRITSSGLIVYLCLFTSLASLSIISQVSSILSSSGISMKKYLLSRPIHAILSCTCGYFLYSLFPPHIDTISQPSAAMFEYSPLVSLLLLAMAVYLFCYENILKNDKNLL